MSQKSVDIDELRARAERLLALLSEEEPGLGTWHAAVGGALDEIAAHAPSFTKVPPQPDDGTCEHWRACRQCISQSTGNALREHLERKNAEAGRLHDHLERKNAEVDRLRHVIRTGGAMYRLERATMGIPGGIDHDDGLARAPKLVDERWCDCPEDQANKCVRDNCVTCCHCGAARPYRDDTGKTITADEAKGLQRDIDHAGRVVNHEEATQLATARQEQSNLARCYLDLVRQRAPSATTAPMIALGFDEVKALTSAAEKGEGPLRLVLQLLGIPPCETCGFVKSHCRCVKGNAP